MVNLVHGWMHSLCKGVEQLKLCLTQPCLRLDFGLAGNIMECSGLLRPSLIYLNHLPPQNFRMVLGSVGG